MLKGEVLYLPFLLYNMRHHLIQMIGNKKEDPNFQSRSFILSSFSRMRIPITQDIKNFCDYLIDKQYQFDLGSLDVVDRQVLQEFKHYMENVNDN